MADDSADFDLPPEGGYEIIETGDPLIPFKTNDKNKLNIIPWHKDLMDNPDRLIAHANKFFSETNGTVAAMIIPRKDFNWEVDKEIVENLDISELNLQKFNDTPCESHNITSLMFKKSTKLSAKKVIKAGDFLEMFENEEIKSGFKVEDWRELRDLLEKKERPYPAGIKDSILEQDPSKHLCPKCMTGLLATLNQLGEQIEGVTFPYVYVGVKGNCFALHMEDGNMGSANLMVHVKGWKIHGQKVWVSFDRRDIHILTKAAKEEHSGIDLENMSKNLYLKDLKVIARMGVRLQVIIQVPGVLILTSGFHCGTNTGQVVNIAWNYADVNWLCPMDPKCNTFKKVRSGVMGEIQLARDFGKPSRSQADKDFKPVFNYNNDQLLILVQLASRKIKALFDNSEFKFDKNIRIFNQCEYYRFCRAFAIVYFYDKHKELSPEFFRLVRKRMGFLPPHNSNNDKCTPDTFYTIEKETDTNFWVKKVLKNFSNSDICKEAFELMQVLPNIEILAKKDTSVEDPNSESVSHLIEMCKAMTLKDEMDLDNMFKDVRISDSFVQPPPPKDQHQFESVKLITQSEDEQFNGQLCKDQLRDKSEKLLLKSSSSVTSDNDSNDGENGRMFENTMSEEVESSKPSPPRTNTNTVNLDKLKALYQDSVMVIYHKEPRVKIDTPDELRLQPNKVMEAIINDMRVFDCVFNDLGIISRQKMINYFKSIPALDLSSEIPDLIERATRFPPKGWHVELNRTAMRETPSVSETSKIIQSTSRKMRAPVSKCSTSAQAIDINRVAPITTKWKDDNISKRSTSVPVSGRIEIPLAIHRKRSLTMKRKMEHNAQPSNPTKIILTSSLSDDEDSIVGDNGGETETSHESALQSNDEKEEDAVSKEEDAVSKEEDAVSEEEDAVSEEEDGGSEEEDAVSEEEDGGSGASDTPNSSSIYKRRKPLFPTIKPTTRPSPPKDSEEQIEMLKRHLSATEPSPLPKTTPNTSSWYLQTFMNGVIKTFFQNAEIGLGFIPFMINFVSSTPKTSNLWTRLTSNDSRTVKRVWNSIPGFNELTTDDEAKQRFIQDISSAITIDKRSKSGNRWSGVYYQEFGYLIRRLILQVADTLRMERPISYDKNYKNWVINNINVNENKFAKWFKKILPPLLFPSDFADPENDKVMLDVDWKETLGYYTTNFDWLHGLEYDVEHVQMNPGTRKRWCTMGAIALYDWMEQNKNGLSNSSKDDEGVQDELGNQSLLEDSNVNKTPTSYQLHIIDHEANDHQVLQENQLNPLQVSFDDVRTIQSNPDPNPEDFNLYELLNGEGSETSALTLSQEIRHISHQNMIDECIAQLNASAQSGINPEVLFSTGELDNLLADWNIGKNNGNINE